MTNSPSPLTALAPPPYIYFRGRCRRRSRRLILIIAEAFIVQVTL